MLLALLSLVALLAGCAPAKAERPAQAPLAEMPAGLSPDEQLSFEVLRGMYPRASPAWLLKDMHAIRDGERKLQAHAVRMADEYEQWLADKAREKQRQADAEARQRAEEAREKADAEARQRAEEARARREALPETTRI